MLYRATHASSIVGYDPEEAKQRALFGTLSQVWYGMSPASTQLHSCPFTLLPSRLLVPPLLPS